MSITFIENFRAVFYSPFYAAFELQAYEAEGLEVCRVISTDPAQTMHALLSGQGHVAWGGPIRLLTANSQQPDSGLPKFAGVDIVLGPEMKSTGEVMGVSERFSIAFAKSQLAAGIVLPTEGRIFISVASQQDKEHMVGLAGG